MECDRIKHGLDYRVNVLPSDAAQRMEFNPQIVALMSGGCRTVALIGRRHPITQPIN